MTLLAPDELADFWALGIPVDARYVPDDEFQRALSEKRVQEASLWSSMGTAEAWWRHATERSLRVDCVVVPPGRVADHWDESFDTRDVDAHLWQPHWIDQRNAALRPLRAEHHRPTSRNARGCSSTSSGNGTRIPILRIGRCSSGG